MVKGNAQSETSDENEAITEILKPADQPSAVVGVGASAGGLRAFQALLSSIPEDSDLAFVLIQHLDPTHASMLSEILSKDCALPVSEIEPNTVVEAGHVYVTSPNTFVTIQDGALQVQLPDQKRGQRTPIDFFLRTLAVDQKERAVGIVLSGSGSDGRTGLSAITAEAGLTLVQDPEEAEFPQMPQAAIDSDCVDLVRPAGQMIKSIMAFINHRKSDAGASDSAENFEERQIKCLIKVVHQNAGLNFDCYKPNTLRRRIFRRMGLKHISDLQSYIKELQDNQHEAKSLANDLLISVTSFYRDRKVWDQLEDEIIPKIIKNADPNTPIRIWVPACATGEEAYSYGIAFQRVMKRIGKTHRVQIYATDIDDRARDIAREGIYSKSISADLEDEIIEDYFEEADEHHYRVRKHLRDMLVFARQDIIYDPPFSKLDLVSCRNLLIYLTSEVQKRIIHSFHFGLKLDGYLVLGNAENISSHSNEYITISKPCRIYRKIGFSYSPDTSFAHSKKLPQSVANGRETNALYLEDQAQRLLTKHLTVAGVFVDSKYNLLFSRGEVHHYLNYAEGMPNSDILALVPQVLKTRLRKSLRTVFDHGEPIILEDLAFTDKQQKHRTRITLSRVQLKQRNSPAVFIIFEDEPQTTTPVREVLPDQELEDSDMLVQHLEDELRNTRSELKDTIEDSQTSDEELKAANEEVISMNEELQSTNEELETSKEELQSLNEELTTLNQQIEEKMKQLEVTSDDLQTLLVSSDVATLFLDEKNCVQRYTPKISKLFNLITSDIGRPLSDLSPRFNDPHLLEDTKTVLEDLTILEKEIQNTEGEWFFRRILPYRTSSNQIKGIVITFFDITDHKQHQVELNETATQLNLALKAAELGIYKYKLKTDTLSFDERAQEIFGLEPGHAISYKQFLSCVQPEERDRIHDVLHHISHQQENEHFIVEFRILPANGGAERLILINGLVATYHSKGEPHNPTIIGTIADVTETRQAETQLLRAKEGAEAANRTKTAFLANMSHDIRTPLTAIGGYSELLSGMLEGEPLKIVEQMRMAGDHLLRTLNSVLKFAKMEGAREKPEIVEIDISTALHNAASMFRHKTDEKSIQLCVESEQSIYAQGDQSGLDRILTNLLDNAVKFSPEKATITLRAENTADDLVRISVKDQGRGISPEFKERIFEPFTQEREQQDTALGGSGLGLAICRQLALEMGGDLQVESETGQGSRFTLTLPAATEAHIQKAKSAKLERSNAAPTNDKPASRPRILACDDYANTRRILEISLRKYPLDLAANEEELFEKLDGQDVILLDINLNGKNVGQALLARLRQTQTGRCAKIFAFTAHALPGQHDQFLKQGFDGYLEKPFTQGRLFEVLGIPTSLS